MHQEACGEVGKDAEQQARGDEGDEQGNESVAMSDAVHRAQ
jgi:hypothetical protein